MPTLSRLAALGDQVVAMPGHAFLSAVDLVRRSRAQQNPDYPSPADNSLDAMLARHEIERESLADVPGEAVARFLMSRPLQTATMEISFAWQRVTRGWDDRALWSLDAHTARTLSAQLGLLADRTHGWPQSDEYPTFEDWRAALLAAADKLAKYEARLFDLDPASELAINEGQQAMRWVADNFPALWD